MGALVGDSVGRLEAVDVGVVLGAGVAPCEVGALVGVLVGTSVGVRVGAEVAHVT